MKIKNESVKDKCETCIFSLCYKEKKKEEE